MRKFGLIGGIGPETTIVYYRLIIKRFQELTGSNSYPSFIINNIDMTKMIDLVVNKDYEHLTEMLENSIADIQKSGVDFGAIASNTPHIVYDKLIAKINIPIISIVEEACKKAQELNLKTVGLFGTKSTMTNGFYQQTASKFGLEIIIPSTDEIAYIHEKYMNELIYNDIRKETKERLIKIADKLQRTHSIQGLIIGGTELSLILSQQDFENIKLLDTAKIHVDSIVKEMIKN